MRSSIFRGLVTYRLALIVLAIVSLAPATYAQFDTATVLGTITDATGAAVPKASVSLKNLATGITVTAQTDEHGNYQFFNVKIGSYQVSAEATGFARGLAENVQVTVDARQRVDLALKEAH